MPPRRPGRGREALLEGWDGLGGSSGDWEGSEGPPREPGGVRRLFPIAEGVGRPFRRVRMGWDALLENRA